MKNGRIKVIHVADKFGVKGSSIHGVSRLFSWMIPRFDKNRYDVRLIGLRHSDQASADLILKGIDVISLGKGRFALATIPELVRIVKNEKADILHLHGYGATNFGRIVAKITGIRNVCHEHAVFPTIPIYQVSADYCLAKFVDIGIAVSNSVKDFMVKRRFLPEQKVKVIFNGAPLGDFKPAGQSTIEAERKRWCIPDGCKVIATIGRLDEQKGIRYFIDAARDVLKKNYGLKFMVVGDGPLMGTLKEQCEQYGIGGEVIFTGYCSNIALIQSIIDVQVFPSLWEGTPLTIFEAMAMRRAIVSTPVDGLGEVLRDGENALLISPRDGNSIARAIEELINNSGKAQQIAEQAQCDSHDFDIQKTVDQIQQIYDELMH